MAIQDIWFINLKALVEREGGGRRGIRAIADVSGLSEEYVYQLLQKKPNSKGVPREIGKEAARKISKAFADGRDESWFDSRPSEQKTQINSKNQVKSPTEAEAVLAALKDWRMQASPRSLEVIDQLTVLAQKDALRDDDWKLLQQMAVRLKKTPS